MVLLLYLLALPLLLTAAVAAFGWRYRRTVAASMARSLVAEAPAPPFVAPPGPAPVRPPLRIDRLDAAQFAGLTPAGAPLQARAAALTRTHQRCLLIAGGLYGGVLAALQLWAMTPVWWRVWPLVAWFAVVPGAVVLLGVVARSRRAWAAAAAGGTAGTAALVLGLGLRLGDVGRAAAVAGDIAQVYALPGLAVLVLMQRRLRSLLVGLVPVLCFLLIGALALALLSDWLGLPADLGQLTHAPDLRWPGSVMLTLGAGAAVASVGLFLHLLRSRRRGLWAIGLAAIGIAGVVLDQRLQPRFPLGPLLAALPAGVLQCGLVWLLLKAVAALQHSRRLPPQALQFHLCWAYLALHAQIVAAVQLADAPAWQRHLADAVVVAGFVAYVLLLHGLLRRAWRAHAGTAPKRLLLLRVFGAAEPRERLLDALDDSWRRVGCIDLIAGTDLAMRTLGSWMLEYFLLRRTDDAFAKSTADVDRRVGRLRRLLEGDLRYPVNSVFCYASAWRAAVARLARDVDAVLLDLRGFSRAHRGCEFELGHLVHHVPLARVVVLADDASDQAAIDDVARAAWATLGPDSPNAGPQPAPLCVLMLDGARDADAVPQALFRAASEAPAGVR